MTPEEFVARALDVPFKDLGRDWSGWDCWGLCARYFGDVLGIDLPAYDAGYETAGDTPEDREAILALAASGLAAWRRVDRPEPGNLLVLRCFGRPIHAGVVVDPARFLHAEKRLGTVIERLASPVWARRIEGAYRHAAG